MTSGYVSKILAADDDPAILKFLTKVLSKPGFQVEVALNGREAVAAIQRETPDFLITDWDMPDVDGPELCRLVRAMDLPHYVYILFLTGKTAPEDLLLGFEAGADDFLTKPFSPGELLSRLQAGARVVAHEKQLRLEAKTDPLTGLATKRSLTEQCAKEMSRVHRHGGALTCVMLDVDYFKRVNDTHGHGVGDKVLAAIGQEISTQCRESDFVCRYGGEEFCALLIETDSRQAMYWAERVRKAISALSFPVGNSTLRVTASMGIAQLLDDVKVPQGLIEKADQALLVAKQSGRDRAVDYAELAESGDLQAGQVNKDDPFHDLVAQDVMSTPVACLQQSDSVRSAVDFFLRFRITSSPVVDEEGRLVGILSEKDCISIMHRPDSWKLPIRDVMRTTVVCFEEDTAVKPIHEFFCRVSIRRVIIVKDERPTGVISRTTLLRWYYHWVMNRTRGEDLAEGIPVTHEHVLETAEFLAREARALHDKLVATPEFRVPIIVHGTTRIQDMAANLLAASRTELPAGYNALHDSPML